MIVWRGLDEVPESAGPYAVTIGTFDGVHLGHREVIARTREVATGLGVGTAVLTFDPHPLTVVRPDAAPKALASLDRRLAILAYLGVDAVLVVPFTPELAAVSAPDFVARYLADTLHARAVVVGAGFRFGHRAAGDVALLRTIAARSGFEVHDVALVRRGHTVSSTAIRDSIKAGDVTSAWQALGRPHVVEGTVVVGDRRGRELGYPTANLAVPEAYAVPPDGVYAGWLVRADGTRLPAAISVGTNPTFGPHARRVEAYVLDRDDLELYGEQVAIEFGWWLRDMVAYEGVDPLLAQMADDVERSRQLMR